MRRVLSRRAISAKNTTGRIALRDRRSAVWSISVCRFMEIGPVTVLAGDSQRFEADGRFAVQDFVGDILRTRRRHGLRSGQIVSPCCDRT